MTAKIDALDYNNNILNLNSLDCKNKKKLMVFIWNIII